jgi:magnesium transporter
MRKKKIILDESKLSLLGILSHRVPWLFFGLIGGIGVTYVVSSFEDLLAKNIHLAFFVPLIIYLSDSFGTQSETLYIRAVSTRNIHMGLYLLKEMVAGAVTGILFGILLWAVAVLWLNDFSVALAVGLAMVVNMVLAPIVALTVAVSLENLSSDPAFGAGPFATILQDLVSVSVYLVVAMMIFKTI